MIPRRDVADPIADGFDDPGRLVPEDRGEVGRVEPLDEVEITVTDTGGDDPDQHLLSDRIRHVDILDPERLPHTAKNGCFHPCAPDVACRRTVLPFGAMGIRCRRSLHSLDQPVSLGSAPDNGAWRPEVETGVPVSVLSRNHILRVVAPPPNPTGTCRDTEWYAPDSETHAAGRSAAPAFFRPPFLRARQPRAPAKRRVSALDRNDFRSYARVGWPSAGPLFQTARFGADGLAARRRSPRWNPAPPHIVLTIHVVSGMPRKRRPSAKERRMPCPRHSRCTT